MNLEHAVANVIAIFAVALVVGVVAERLRMPYIVALLIVSLPISLHGSEQLFVESFLLLLLPILIFEASWNFHSGELRRVWRAVSFMSIGGVIVTVFAVGGGLALFGRMPLLAGLLLGAIVAPTDPIAVIATFKRLAVPTELAVTVEGESLFNDGVGIVLYLALTTSVASGVAGIFAATLAAIIYRWLERRRGGDAQRVEHIDTFWGLAAFLANSVVFLIVGLRIELPRIIMHPGIVFMTLAFVVAARLVCVYGALPFLGVKKNAWKHVVALSGIRGGVSIALALALPEATPYRNDIIDAVYGVVAVTILVQGLALGPIMKRLQLTSVE